MVRALELADIEAHVSRRRVGGGVLALLALSLICVAAAPMLMPDSYSIVEHSVSESAAQRLDGVWPARTGLLLFGLGVLVLAGGDRWGLWPRIAHRTYGVAMISTAVFAHKPWQDVPYDEFEDLLHSIASFAVGLGFVAGVILVGMTRTRPSPLVRAFDGLAVAVSVVVPMIMFNLDGYAGLVQRIMFLVAYAWYASEAWRSVVPRPQSIVWEADERRSPQEDPIDDM